MQNYSSLLFQSHVADVFGQAWKTGEITPSNRESLMAAFLDESLSDEDHATIDRLYHAVRRGWLHM